MADAPDFRYPVSEQIRRYAMRFPEAAEGSSCVNRAFSAGGKNFVFLGEKDDLCTLRLKLDSGWTKVEFEPTEPPSTSELESWIEESFLLLAPKRVRSTYGDQPS